MEFKEYIELKSKVEEFEKAQSSNVATVVEYVMRSNDINYFAAVGYTPSFNDGDPCTYSFDTADDYFDSEIEDYKEDSLDISVEEYVSNLDSGGEYAKEAAVAYIAEAIKGGWASKEAKEYNEKVSVFSDYEEIFRGDNDYGQKYFGFIDSNNKFHFYQEEYECGY